MSSLIGIENFHQVFEEPCPARRGRLAGGLFADYEAGTLNPSERQAARSLFRAIVRDPACATRRTFARMVALSPGFPADLAQIIAGDVAAVAKRFIQMSPVLDIAALVDIVGSGQAWRQVAVARRAGLDAPVAAALAEVAVAKACVALLENEAADIPMSGFARLQERFSDDGNSAHHSAHDSADDSAEPGQVNRALLNRRTVPGSVVEAQIMATSDRLLSFVETTGWMGSQSARAAVTNAVEHALVEFAARHTPHQVGALVGRWAQAGQMTPMLILRAAAYGQFSMALHGLAAAANLPVSRAWSLASDPSPYGLRGLCNRAGLPKGAGEFIAAARTLTACHRFGPRRDFVLRGLIAGQKSFGKPLALLPMRFAREAGLGKFSGEAVLVNLARQADLVDASPNPQAQPIKRAA